jgi:hypothetical protein
MGSGVKRTIWADESTCSDCDQAGIEERAVAVDVDAFAEPIPMSLGCDPSGWRTYLRMVP